MRGRKRSQPGYHASRGWFYEPIQKVIKKWDNEFDREFINDNFLKIRKVMEEAHGEIKIEGVQHRRFVCELMTALDKLHDPKCSDGWVVKVWPLVHKKKPDPKKKKAAPIGYDLFTYEEMKFLIEQSGGPTFSVDALKKTATRLKMLETGEELEYSEFTVHNPNASLTDFNQLRDQKPKFVP